MTLLQSARFTRRRQLWMGVAVGAGIACVLVVMWALGWFTNARLSLSNLYFVASQHSSQVVIVAIDDQTLQALGRSPMEWQRRHYADLVRILNAGGARVVAFDLLFAEASEDDALFAEAIAAVRSSETRTRVILPISGVANQVGTATLPDGSGALAFSSVLRPVEPLASGADYLAFVNTLSDADGLIRRQASWVTIAGEPQPGISLTLAAYLAYLRVPAAAVGQIVTRSADGLLQVTPERALTTDAQGLWLQNFYGAPSVNFDVYSMLAVLNETVSVDEFNDKIVLVGLMNAQGATDSYYVPTSGASRQMAGVEVQAHGIETLLRNGLLTEQSRSGQVLTMIGCALLAGASYALLRWYFKLALMSFWILAGLIAASLLFSLRGEVTNLLHPLLALTLPALVGIGQDITTEIRRRQQTELLLQSVVDMTQQQMALDKVMRSIADDVRRITPVETCAVRLYPEGSGDPYTYDFPMDSHKSNRLLTEVCANAYTGGKLTRQAAALAVPVRWQGRVIGVIGAQLAGRARANAAALLEDLAAQIAPGVANALLYAEVLRQKLLSEAILNGSPTYIAILDDQYAIVQANAVFQARLAAQL
ncbi:MAG: CHASE2 domain-containing protein, partial [Armatimonadetes bacterium]|nr:CHASE2 domain-containing protein [Anaerolineae bacterium]